jgi:16S rRNA (cytidine1402-2'-O)-methyltransferase
MGNLYLVATPIGNLEDVTLRALRVLKEVDLIAAEDTRTARKLLSRYDIHTPLVSYNDRNKRLRTPALLERLADGDVALVSEAGMPAISDPGQDLVRAAYEAGAKVVPVPGPSAITTALAASGLSTRAFTYLGFLPRQATARRRLLESLATRAETLIAFESPHRLRETLSDIKAAFGDRQIAVCRELTKLYEEVFRGRVSEALQGEPRGEFTLVIAGAAEAPSQDEAPEDIVDEMRRLREGGVGAQEAVARLSKRYGLSRRRLYRLWLDKKNVASEREQEGG